MERCLQEGLFCNGVAQRLGLPSGSLARWLRQGHIDGARRVPATSACSPARSALNSSGSIRRTARSGERRIFQAGGSALCVARRASACGESSCRREVSPDRSTRRSALGCQAAPGKRAAENARLTAEIQALFGEHRDFYGSPRIHQELRAAGHRVGRHRVARLMQRAELKARTRKPFRPCSKGSGEAAGVVEDLLQQEFALPCPHRCWAGAIDVTQARTTHPFPVAAPFSNAHALGLQQGFVARGPHEVGLGDITLLLDFGEPFRSGEGHPDREFIKGRSSSERDGGRLGDGLLKAAGVMAAAVRKAPGGDPLEIHLANGRLHAICRVE